MFGVGSDIAGSIRVPAMFNGIFGHKPTSGIVSLNGHFPNSSNEYFQKYLVIGPMARYARDLPTLLHIMAGENAFKLKLDEPLYTKDIQVILIILINKFIRRNIPIIYPYISDFLHGRFRIFFKRYTG